ncbi:MAG: GHMP kinase [Nitrososphaerota archaeon]|jgi:D-glycero-alpha-D-manno-heptose-7-phosphate kinase|nr:GHMP kinase [Nitrososphaerota archaeon]MDG7040710.1 GHMP kinase [Nitrososphaerota archaeon]
MIVRGRAPFRISFGGGGTDVPPYCWEEGGAVLNSTIDRYAYSTVETSGKGYEFISYDTGTRAKYDKLTYDGRLDLLKAVMRVLNAGPGTMVSTYSEAPAGSGLGGSSTLAVSLATALSADLSKYDLAMTAYRAEREELRQAGGYQDQFASAYGGINYMEFIDGRVNVVPLRLPYEVIAELQYRSLLFYLGRNRLSSAIHDSMKHKYSAEEGEQRELRRRLKAIAQRMKDELNRGNVDEFGILLDENWNVKKGMSELISNGEIDRLYDKAIAAGALGGKVLGAGGGGHMLIFCRADRRQEVMKEMVDAGLINVQFAFENGGAVHWKLQE